MSQQQEQRPTRDRSDPGPNPVKEGLVSRYPLLFRLVCFGLLCSLLASGLVAGIQLWLTRSQALAEIRHSLVDVERSMTGTLANSVWSFNREALRIELDSMLQHPDIVAVTLETREGGRFEAGRLPDPDSGFIRRSFVLRKSFRGQDLDLGQVTLYASLNRVSRLIHRQLSTSLILELAALLATGGAILGLFLLGYNRHINRIAEFAEELRLDNLDRELRLERRKKNDRGDELDRIVLALNEMRHRLRQGLAVRQEMEARLKREIGFSDGIINGLPGLFAVFSEEMRAIRCNDRYCETLGIRRQEAPDLRLEERIVQVDRQRYLDAVTQTFSQGTPLLCEVEMLTVHGRAPYLLAGSLLELEGERYLITMGTDISERKKIEENLRQAQKMEVMGTLAGGIAHDFNNILTAIMGNLQLAQTYRDQPGRLAAHLQSALDATFRARDLVAQILSMSRHGERRREPLQLALLLKETLKLLRASIPVTIEISQQIESDGYILADTSQIHQVIMNLCTNSYQAMADSGGELRVVLREQYIDGSGSGDDIAPGDYLCLEISDTGCGMDQATMERIFEPYFTTKGPGSGTGLGLAVVQGIVQGHNGRISVVSEPGRGTTFTVLFPRLEERAGEEKSTPVDSGQDLDGRERVLIVDDETHILEVVSEILTMHGYTVTACASADAALEVFTAAPDEVDLVITDMTMPGMTGAELGRAMLAIRPRLPVILCTGFSRTMGREESLRAGFAAYLEKPVEAEQLLRTVREVLDRRDQPALRLILADDDPAGREVGLQLLQSRGYRVLAAENGAGVLTLLAREQVDGVILDLRMPHLDGPSTAAIIRGCEAGDPEQIKVFCEITGQEPTLLAGGRLPIIGLSGDTSARARQRCLAAGINGLLAKPYTVSTLDRIGDLIRGGALAENPVQEDCPCDDEVVTPARSDQVIGYLRATYPLDDDQIHTLLREGVGSLADSLQAVEQALERGDRDALDTVLHRMKGTLLGLGLEQQAGWISRFRQGGHGLERAPVLYRRLRESLDSLLEEDHDQSG